MNNLIFIIETVTVFGLLTLTNKFFKRDGVIAWVAALIDTPFLYLNRKFTKGEKNGKREELIERQ